MPYLTNKRKNEIELGLPVPVEELGPGDLNYMFTILCQDYIWKKGEKYQHYNDCIGALESCKLEFYRRAVAPYEDKKCKDNGDVYFSEKNN